MDFHWNEWNLAHVGKHGVGPEEAEAAVRGAARPFPLARENAKWLVWGRGDGGRILQVVYVVDPEGTLYVIHARELTDREKRIRRRGGHP